MGFTKTIEQIRSIAAQAIADIRSAATGTITTLQGYNAKVTPNTRKRVLKVAAVAVVAGALAWFFTRQRNSGSTNISEVQ